MRSSTSQQPRQQTRRTEQASSGDVRERASRLPLGAAAALKRGASLLAAGVTAVDGKFRRGDVVAILGPAGDVLGRGLAGYDADDARAIRGLRGEAQAAVLGYAPRAALVHADHLVML